MELEYWYMYLTWLNEKSFKEGYSIGEDRIDFNLVQVGVSVKGTEDDEWDFHYFIVRKFEIGWVCLDSSHHRDGSLSMPFPIPDRGIHQHLLNHFSHINVETIQIGRVLANFSDFTYDGDLEWHIELPIFNMPLPTKSYYTYPLRALD